MIRRLIILLIGLVCIVIPCTGALIWFTCRIYVPPDQCAVLIRKTGKALPSGQKVATEPNQKGIQEKVLGPGRYFRNPYTWEWKLQPLTVIPAGNPGTWEWVHSLSDRQRDQLRADKFVFKGDFPKIGVVTRKIGKKAPTDQVIVDRASGQEGILAEVLTPGVYKINPYVYNVEIHPAVVIPAGFVGVVTNMFGNQLEDLAVVKKANATTTPPQTQPEDQLTTSQVRPLAQPGQRGTLRDVLQPGVYFINPKLQKVTLVEIGFNEYSQLKVSDTENLRIAFPSDTGYLIRVGVTVVWGIHPDHAAEIINQFGNVDRVLDKVIEPQLRSICRNIGSTFAARDFIRGEQREQFQKRLTEELQNICRGKNIEVLLALVREIEVHAPGVDAARAEVTEDLKRTIQRSYIAIENQITKEKQREAATTKAQLEEEKKKVEIAKETITAETRVMVADIRAEGVKKAAETDAQAGLEVAAIQQEVARLDAERIEILGQADADVERFKKEAEAEGYRLLVEAFGSPRAYNLYTFAEKFEPDSIQLFFAGEGTFWTDLSRLEQMGAAKLLKSSESVPPIPESDKPENQPVRTRKK